MIFNKSIEDWQDKKAFFLGKSLFNRWSTDKGVSYER
jgi:hypothetical protein